jgi:hypothetical protein
MHVNIVQSGNFYTMERFWNANIESGLAFSIWKSKGQNMDTWKVDNQTANLNINY